MKNEDLERIYKSFIDDQRPFEFFKGVAEYLDYIFGVPSLRVIFTKQLEKRNAEYEQGQKLEKLAITEIRNAKHKIEKIFKKRKVDTKTLKRFETHSPLDDYNFGIMQEWEDYNSGKLKVIRGGHFRCNRLSDDINDLVGDMASNLYSLGYKKDLKEFLVSDEEYKKYYRRIAPPNTISRTSNPHGNFIFSQTLPARWEIEHLIETERYTEPWGAFEKLYQFWRAHKNIRENNINASLEEMKKVKDSQYLIEIDKVDVRFMQIDFQNLLGDQSSWYKYSISTWKPNHLKVDQIKSATKTVHNILMCVSEEVVISGEKLIKGSIKMDFDSQNGVIRCGEIKPYSFHRGLKGNKPLLQLFRKLWDERRHILKGRERKKGESFPLEALASQINVESVTVPDKLKSISRMLKTRKFPARIERKNGALLIVEE
ncbi:MAG: hypothetical protein Q7S73_02315 [bacterium]|nr:hypothetical protein [bacterium]